MTNEALPWLFLGLVIACLCVGLATAAFHAWWRMPFIPTPQVVADAMIRSAALKSGDRVYDLGCGDGRLLLTALKSCPGIRATGYEGALGVWILGKLRTRSSVVKILREDFMRADLSDANAVFLYLSPTFMERLAPKFARELKSGTRIVSHAFQFKDRKPASVEVIDVPLWGRSRVFTYIW